MTSAELTHRQAAEIFRGLDSATTKIRAIVAEHCPDDDVWTWSAELLIGDEWTLATMPDHYPEGAEIHW